jgi:hypothetical protein
MADDGVLQQALPVASPNLPYGPERANVFLDAWQTVCTMLDALAPEEIVQPNVPVREAALLGLRVANAIESDAAMKADFVRLAETPFFQERFLHELPLAARALLYLRAHVDSERAPSGALSPELLAQAKELHTRMLKVLAFYFDRESEVGSELVRIRSARGHAGLAGALVSLATLYDTHRDRLVKTPEHYHATDAQEALVIAEAIVAHLTAPDSSARWGELQAPLWTLFVNAYEEVCAAGRFIYRHDRNRDVRFPALVSLNVARRNTAKRRGEPDPTPPHDPS